MSKVRVPLLLDSGGVPPGREGTFMSGIDDAAALPQAQRRIEDVQGHWVLWPGSGSECCAQVAPL